MRYISTRGQSPALSFEGAMLAGLASDGGLYVPEKIPQFSKKEIASWASLSYQELAFKVMSPFVDGEVPSDDLRELIYKTYSTFRHDAIAPLVQTAHNEFILELFHGPTLAFKDFALQFLGNLLDYVLKKKDQRVVIMGATSGDTGSAAIEGCRHSDNVDIFILHPHNRVSEVQRRQMTTVLQDNVFNIALEGNFDDCQNMVKSSFGNQAFLPPDRQLVAVNSINWVRIMAQIVYYFYAGLALDAPHRPVSFSVPTGNFGDIFAGYLAKKMGLPIDKLVIATNANDILHRCISNNNHSLKTLVHSLSPSMDIMVSSNFERMLFDLYDQDGETINNLMLTFKTTGKLTLSDPALVKARAVFTSYRLDDKAITQVMADFWEATGYLLDPHTAIGVEAARKTLRRQDVPVVCLSTAHPAKFPESIRKAGFPSNPELPRYMADLFDRQEDYSVQPNSIEVVQQFIADNIR
ncbi:MAG: threonine synthase [Porticoccus sp.]